jgi:hypothetical protein
MGSYLDLYFFISFLFFFNLAIEKNNKKNCEKKLIKPIRILKNRPVRFGFGFIGLKPKKPSQIKINSFCSKITKPEPVSVRFRFFLKKLI